MLPRFAMLDNFGGTSAQVKNTFLEFGSPEPLKLLRCHTAPDSKTADTLEEPDGSAYSGEDNASGERIKYSYPDACPAKISLQHLKTGDFLELEPDGSACSTEDSVFGERTSHSCMDAHSEDITLHSPRKLVAPAASSIASGDNVGGCADHLHGQKEVPAQLPQLVPNAWKSELKVKNTFIDHAAPDPPNFLSRYASTPSNRKKQDIVEEDIPAPLQLEFWATGDRFEDPIDEHAPLTDFLPRGMPCHTNAVYQHDCGMSQGAGLGVLPCTLPVGPIIPHAGPAAAAPAVPPMSQATSRWPPCAPPPPEAPPVVEVPGDAELPAVPHGDAMSAFTSICQPNKLTCTECAGSGWSRVQWAVDARKLESKDKYAVSPLFMIDLPNHGQAAFRMQLYPTPTNQGRGKEGFKKTKGRGRIELKCESRLSQDVDEVTFRVGIGNKEQTTRGPVSVNFLQSTCGGLPKAEEEWQFAPAIDDSRTFLVYVELEPPVRAATLSLEEKTSEAGSS